MFLWITPVAFRYPEFKKKATEVKALKVKTLPLSFISGYIMKLAESKETHCIVDYSSKFFATKFQPSMTWIFPFPLIGIFITVCTVSKLISKDLTCSITHSPGQQHSIQTNIIWSQVGIVRSHQNKNKAVLSFLRPAQKWFCKVVYFFAGI